MSGSEPSPAPPADDGYEYKTIDGETYRRRKAPSAPETATRRMEVHAPEPPPATEAPIAPEKPSHYGRISIR